MTQLKAFPLHPPVAQVSAGEIRMSEKRQRPFGIVKAFLADLLVGLHILWLALKNYRSPLHAVQVLTRLYLLKKAILGGVRTKIIKVNNRYHYYLYAPGFPSAAFDRYIEAEMNRIRPLNKKTNSLTFIILAITTKCPLQCEHCFEWEHLNKKESLTVSDLKKVVATFEHNGLAQFHFSGGEPMVRVRDLINIISTAKKEAEFYVLTSGFNFTRANARALKQAGLTGVVISLDHFEPEKHNAFRGLASSFTEATDAVAHALSEGLVVTLTLCTTRAITTAENLLQYAALAKKLGVHFIQLLEPKSVGHFAGKDVVLSKEHFEILENFYTKLNFDPAYKTFPIVVYHGFHLRRSGCYSGGNRMLYIDAEGYANACPFCSSRTVNVKAAMADGLVIQDCVKAAGCAEYQNAKG